MTDEIVPFLDLVTPHRELEEELIAVVREAVRGARFIGGPEVEGLEREFADYCGAKYCVGLASGTDAVRFALMGAGVRPGDAVVTVANTFIATVEGISQAGAATEFVDIDEQTYCMSPKSLAAYLEACSTDPKTGYPLGQRTGKPIKAIVPVHLYGQVADMDALLEIAQKYRLLVIEDACQAHGAEYKGATTTKRAGALGKAAAFSFYPGKNLGACGEAGAITTDDEEVAKYVRMIRDHGQAQKYYHQIEGYNGRLDAIQAAFLRIKLRHLPAWTEQRRAAARVYNELLAPLAKQGLVVTPYEPDWSNAVYHLYVVRTQDRVALGKALNAKGIQTGLHYPVPLHQQQCYADWGYQAGSLPVTERVSNEILSLPMFPGLTPQQQQRVAAAIESAAGVEAR
jgi:dTDP-4-amino-4,6-dideoxygalactose transaminase